MIWEVKFYKNYFDWENIYEFQMFTDHKNYDLIISNITNTLRFFSKNKHTKLTSWKQFFASHVISLKYWVFCSRFRSWSLQSALY